MQKWSPRAQWLNTLEKYSSIGMRPQSTSLKKVITVRRWTVSASSHLSYHSNNNKKYNNKIEFHVHKFKFTLLMMRLSYFNFTLFET